MTNFLYKLKSWQITALGATAVVASLVLVTVVAQVCYALFPAGFAAVAILHIIAAGAVAWFVPTPFIRAYQLQHADAALAHILELLEQAFPDGEVAEVVKPDLDVFEPEANRG
jgi:hypothetical protein